MSLDNSRDRNYQETLSALMDNEADELELRRLLKDLPQRPEIAETWKRFHIARSVLHNEEMRSVSAATTNNIFAAIAAEPAYKAGSEGIRKTVRTHGRLVWLNTAGRFAIAASVALAAFLGLQSALFIPQADLPVADSASTNDTGVQIAVGDQATGFDAEAQRRLNDYIRGVSIQYGDDSDAIPEFNILQDSQLIRQVNQIAPKPAN